MNSLNDIPTIQTTEQESVVSKKQSTSSEKYVSPPSSSQAPTFHSGTRLSYTYITEKIEDGFQAAYETVTHVWVSGCMLVPHSQLPDWSKDNGYLIQWHRAPLPNFGYCFRSIFRWHSETGNIWTHMIGALLFIGLTVYFISVPDTKFVAPFEEKHLISLFLVSAILCLLFSALYHTLSCHSEKILRLFGRLDYSGIALLVMGSFVPWVYYTFYCSTQPRVVYLVTISLLGIGAIVFSQWDRFAKPEYRVVRAAMFSALGASGIIPMIHTVFERGVHFAFHDGQLQWMALMFLMYGTGAVVYATRIPERLYPGKFDLIFQSHQLFHVCVIIGILLHLYCITNLQFYRWQLGTKC